MFSGSYMKQINKDGSEVDILVLGGYAPSHQEMNAGGTSYYGFVNSAGGWYIMKAVTAGAITTYTYATGTSGYATAWTGRAAESYDTFDAQF